MSDIIAPCDFHDRFTGCTARERFAALVESELWLSTKVDTPVLRALPSFACPDLDQFAFKFGESAQDREHQPAMRRSGVGP
jgi:hypothetical protein